MRAIYFTLLIHLQQQQQQQRQQHCDEITSVFQPRKKYRDSRLLTRIENELLPRTNSCCMICKPEVCEFDKSVDQKFSFKYFSLNSGWISMITVQYLRVFLDGIL